MRKGNQDLKMIELITKNSDGTFSYDFNKFFNFEDALMAEWKENSPELDESVFAEIMERLFDKDEICNDGRGRVYPGVWDTFVKDWENGLTDVKEKCWCEELLDEYMKSGETEVCLCKDARSKTVVSMNLFEDRWTKKRLYFGIRVHKEGDYRSYFNEDIKFCPFCGKKLMDIFK